MSQLTRSLKFTLSVVEGKGAPTPHPVIPVLDTGIQGRTEEGLRPHSSPLPQGKSVRGGESRFRINLVLQRPELYSGVTGLQLAQQRIVLTLMEYLR